MTSDQAPGGTLPAQIGYQAVEQRAQSNFGMLHGLDGEKCEEKRFIIQKNCHLESCLSLGLEQSCVLNLFFNQRDMMQMHTAATATERITMLNFSRVASLYLLHQTGFSLAL